MWQNGYNGQRCSLYKGTPHRKKINGFPWLPGFLGCPGCLFFKFCYFLPHHEPYLFFLIINLNFFTFVFYVFLCFMSHIYILCKKYFPSSYSCWRKIFSFLVEPSPNDTFPSHFPLFSQHFLLPPDAVCMLFLLVSVYGVLLWRKAPSSRRLDEEQKQSQMDSHCGFGGFHRDRTSTQ